MNLIKHKKNIFLVFLATLVLFVFIWSIFWGKKASLKPSPSQLPGFSPKIISSYQTQLYMKKQQYDITFLPQTNVYLITVLGSPFEVVRKEAEGAFLEKLKITPEAACLLKVTVGTPPFANEVESEKTYSLSFCQK